MKLLKDKKAFTLIELIVTIAVLGILVLLGAPRLLGHVEQAELTRIQHDVKVMENKMSEVLNQDNDFDSWANNEKDLGTLILRNQLYEKEGIATTVDRSHLVSNVNIAKHDDNLGVGGSVIPLSTESEEEGTGYKIIDEKFKNQINTKLDGTFYANKNGKVYYEPNKPLGSIKQNKELVCVTPESLDYEFEIRDGKGTITGYNGTLTHLYIPSSFLLNVNGEDKCVPVQVIGAAAFSNLGYRIGRVTIPESVEIIEDSAFEGNEFREVEIPHSVDHIGNNAFANNNLERIVVKNNSSNLTIIRGAFSSNPASEDNIVYSPVTDRDLGIIFNKSTGTIVASRAYSSGQSYSGGHTGGRTVRIPSTIVVDGEVHEVKEIAKGAYQGQGIIYVEFPDTLERIEDYAFAGNQLIGVEIPRSVGHVGNYAFAFNEVNGERTMGYVEISEEGDYVNDINNVGNIAPNGVEKFKVGQANLLEHIFITSSDKFEIPEEYNPGFTAPFDVIIKNDGYITDKTELTFAHSYEDEVLEEQWELNGKILPNKPSGTFPSGNYTLKLKLMLNDGKWTNYDSISFTVNEYVEFMMNARGSTVLNDVEYGEGDSLLFNYTNSSNLNWEVPVSGIYEIQVMGASGSNGTTNSLPSNYIPGNNLPKGGNGAKISATLELSENDKLNFKIYKKGNGGGRGSYTSNMGESHYASGKNGGAGTILKVNNRNFVISGGGGGVGGRISARNTWRGYYGAGGNGGHGGRVGLPGQDGQAGSDGINSPRRNYGKGGKSPSAGGQGNVYNSMTSGKDGKRGPTIYDGGGGGGVNGGREGVGGGAGGSSFLHADLVNPVVTDGYNSGDGKVIITLIEAK